jgi:hypothetical protein
MFGDGNHEIVSDSRPDTGTGETEPAAWPLKSGWLNFLKAGVKMIVQVLTIIFSALGVGTIISRLVLRKIDKMDQKQDNREEFRKKESVLLFRGIQAIGHLSEATAENQKLGHANGKTDDALEYYHNFTDALNAYLLQQNAERNHGG